MSEQEFTRLVQQYNKLIFTVCHRFVQDYQEAENLTQDTFLTAYRVIDQFVGENYKPWLVRIATNKCKDFLKSAFHRTTETAEQELESAGQVAWIKRACENLKPPYREVALLHFIEDRSFEEIAVLLDRPVKTVQTQAYRARDKLRKILKEEFHHADYVG